MSTEHAIPVRIYFNVFVILMVLLGVTIAVAMLNLGFFNIIVAMAIAVLKAALVILYFMNLRNTSRLTHVWAGAAIVFLLTLFMLTLSDYFTRWFGGKPGVQLEIQPEPKVVDFR